jgi:ABC-type multidrug transport system ATPase subunit
MRYESLDVLGGVAFSIRPGEVVVLLGPNGAGKTTTIEILEGSAFAPRARYQSSASIRPAPMPGPGHRMR